MPELVTQRLRLRQWRDGDFALFAAMNADPVVMRYFTSPLTTEQSDAFAAQAQAAIDAQGWGLWAVEVIDAESFIGFVGLNRPTFSAHFTPNVEVGWRLDRPHWGKGYATEAGAAALDFGFRELALDEIVSFTATQNEPSIRVMQRLGMRHDVGGDFDHPRAHGPLRRHVLYRLSSQDWGRAHGAPAASPR